ncbi:MAG: (Fe-S)-binding protein [Anaerolineales bacterium]|jgi:Fe-S oxidoreductase
MTEELKTFTLNDDLWQELLELTDGAAAPCFQCGVCTAICPWGDARPDGFSVRGILRAAQLGELGELESLWLCSGCLQCEASCPRGVEISGVIQSLRYLLWRRRSSLHNLPSVLWSCYWNNNPLGQPPSARMDWAVDLNLPDFDPSQHEWLFYVGCTASYDRRAQEVARAAVRVLRAAGVSFGVLGLDEPCCGESVLRLGHRPFFEDMARKALAIFDQREVKHLVALSPHCYDMFAHEYPQLGAEFDVQHITRFVADLLEQGRLHLHAGDPVRVTFHDPCLLGRGNGEYEAPRTILKNTPGLEFAPMQPEGEDGLCCGGGGGRMYLETPPGERFGDTRVRQAQASGASVLATACPLCIACLEDSMKVLGGEPMSVLDVVEIAARHLEPA